MEFTKMHGIGNDYIFIDLTKKRYLKDLRELSIKLSDRHFGVGADGLIVIERSFKADFKMRIFNKDGSEAEMCGNGIRCFGKYVFENQLTNKKTISVETKGGIKYLDLEVINNEVKNVTVDMGEPIFKNKDIIIDDDMYIKINNNFYDINYVSMGNPHNIVVMDDINKIDVDNFGKIISNDYHFPNKTNVEFVELINNQNIKMRVFERGSNETLACGTGACAAVVYCYKKGLTKRKVKVKLLGGDLLINYKNNNHVYMTGTSSIVYRGDIDI